MNDPEYVAKSDAAVYGKEHTALKKRIAELEKENDDLLFALERLVDGRDRNLIGEANWDDRFADARAEIAKAKKRGE